MNVLCAVSEQTEGTRGKFSFCFHAVGSVLNPRGGGKVLCLCVGMCIDSIQGIWGLQRSLIRVSNCFSLTLACMYRWLFGSLVRDCI